MNVLRHPTRRLITHLALACGLILAVVSSTMLRPPPALAVSTTVVISQVYGGAGCGTVGCSTYKNDYIELFNRGSVAQSLNGWSVQYASATGTSWQVTSLPNLSLAPGQYFLVQEGAGANGQLPLPTPDATGSIAMSATAAKVALLNSTAALAGSGCPFSASVVDFAGYGGTANCFEGAGPAPAPSTTTADLRAGGGCTETDANSADFSALAPNPRNSATALNPCGGTPTPTNTPVGTATNTPVPTDTPTPTVTPTPGPVTHIYNIQGSSHRSPLVGQPVSSVPGIVTAKRSNGFYMQDSTGDGDDATSDGIFVFGTAAANSVSVGDAVLVSGSISEFRSGGSSSTNLTSTEIDSPSIIHVSSGNPLPAMTVIGTGGRIPPTTVIEDDASGDVETSGVFDPASDGIDFYESLEDMLVQVNDAVAAGPTKVFGTTSQNREIAILSDNGANASVRTARGGVVVQANDFNPERIILNDLISGGPTLPDIDVSYTFPGAITGVIDYSFGNFKLEVSSMPAAVSGGLTREMTTPAGADQLAIATFNVENLDPGDGAAKFNTLASLIVNNLKAPDLIAIEEVQDNTGPTDDGVVDATTTYNTLIAAIQSAGGPTYQFRQINPVNDQDGGEPGGNIRQGFLFRTDRGLAFVDRSGAGSTTANSVVNAGGVPQLQYSPGRIDPTNTAFNTSRKPLAGEFTFNGRTLFVIANHFNSKGGDQPLYGHFQPPTRSSEVQRHQQAQIVNNFVDDILAVDPQANVVVAGDLNDFEFSQTLLTLEGGVLHDLIETLPQNERYSYEFDGNAQTLDHVLVSDHLFNTVPFAFDVVHINAEFATQASDHDPSTARFTMPLIVPTNTPTTIPTDTPTAIPTNTPTTIPTDTPTAIPTDTPTAIPTDTPTAIPTDTPTAIPTDTPTAIPTNTPTAIPTNTPTAIPTDTPTAIPTDTPTAIPTDTPTAIPTDTPTAIPTNTPTAIPTNTPTVAPTNTPTVAPTNTPTVAPTNTPTRTPVSNPTKTPKPTNTPKPTKTPRSGLVPVPIDRESPAGLADTLVNAGTTIHAH